MFVHAIEQAQDFTRAIHSIQRFYGSHEVLPGAATLFFVNKDGWALTCKHVANLIVASETMAKRRKSFEADFAAMMGKKKDKQILRELEKQYSLTPKVLFEVKNNFINCVHGGSGFQILTHASLDVALIHFSGFTHLHPQKFARFPKITAGLKQGKFLCRLGFPFPEFSNFKYSQTKETIEWTQTGKAVTPWFPIEGMLTRHLADRAGQLVGFEMSTPGLSGQSGGPAFDADGLVWGMQCETVHLDLDFDVDAEVIRNGQKKRVRDSAFLHVGRCVHVDILKAFMGSNNVQFTEV